MIPKVIYQTWKTKDLTGKMAENVQLIKDMNPEYQHILYDDTDCRQFILQNFGENYANAFDALINGAFKADLWRYCMLYVHGGVYMDIDLTPLVPLSKLVSEQDQFVSVVDIDWNGHVGIYQAFLACTPRHPVIASSIDITFANIVTRRETFMDSVLILTGPAVVGRAMNLFWKRKDPNQKIIPGRYPDGIVLYRNDKNYIVDTDGKQLIKNKFTGYKGESYALPIHFKDDNRAGRKKLYLLLIASVLVLLVLSMLCAIFFGKKWKDCQSSCSRGE